jgi:hypothetical protein
MPLLSHVAAVPAALGTLSTSQAQSCGGKKLCEPDGRHPGRYGPQTQTS